MNTPREWAWRLRLKTLSSMNKRAERADDKLLELELSEKSGKLAIALRSFATFPPIPRFLASMPDGEDKFRSFCAVIEGYCAAKDRSERRLLDQQAKCRTQQELIDEYFATLAKLCVFMRYGSLRAVEADVEGLHVFLRGIRFA